MIVLLCDVRRFDYSDGVYIHDIVFFVFLSRCSAENGPCMIVVFRVPYQRETASFTRCLPVDNRLTRDGLKEAIAEDVQQNEAYNVTAVALLGLEFFVALIVGMSVAAKKYCCVRHTCGQPHSEGLRGWFRR